MCVGGGLPWTRQEGAAGAMPGRAMEWQGHGATIVRLGLSLDPMTHPGETQSLLIVSFFLIL